MGHKPWLLGIMPGSGNDGNALPLRPLARKYIEPLFAVAVSFLLFYLVIAGKINVTFQGVSLL